MTKIGQWKAREQVVSARLWAKFIGRNLLVGIADCRIADYRFLISSDFFFFFCINCALWKRQLARPLSARQVSSMWTWDSDEGWTSKSPNRYYSRKAKSAGMSAGRAPVISLGLREQRSGAHIPGVKYYVSECTPYPKTQLPANIFVFFLPELGLVGSSIS